MLKFLLFLIDHKPMVFFLKETIKKNTTFLSYAKGGGLFTRFLMISNRLHNHYNMIQVHLIFLRWILDSVGIGYVGRVFLVLLYSTGLSDHLSSSPVLGRCLHMYKLISYLNKSRTVWICDLKTWFLKTQLSFQ